MKLNLVLYIFVNILYVPPYKSSIVIIVTSFKERNKQSIAASPDENAKPLAPFSILASAF
jgi:hypothetical protein